MRGSSIVRGPGKSLLAVAVAVALWAAPAGFLETVDLGSGTAAAKGGGNGGGNGGGGGGNGGGGGGGKGNGGVGSDKAGTSDSAGSGKSAATAGRGKSKLDSDTLGKGKSGLGSLNASNASPTAREHAAPTSRVGQIAAYEAALAAGDLDAAAQALAGAANKEITPEVVAEVNANIGVTSSPEEEAAIAALAESARTAEPTEEEEVAEETTEEEQVADESTDEGTEDSVVASAADDLIGDSPTQ